MYVLSSAAVCSNCKVTVSDQHRGFQLTGVVCSFPVHGMFSWLLCVLTPTFELVKLIRSLFYCSCDLDCKVFLSVDFKMTDILKSSLTVG